VLLLSPYCTSSFPAPIKISQNLYLLSFASSLTPPIVCETLLQIIVLLIEQSCRRMNKQSKSHFVALKSNKYLH
jgi:hypothetical protein